MAYFTLDEVDYDQSGGGLFDAVPEVQGQVPITVNAYKTMAGPDRPDYYLGVMERAITFHPQGDFDWRRTQSEYVGRDDFGQFLAVRDRDLRPVHWNSDARRDAGIRNPGSVGRRQHAGERRDADFRQV